MSSLQVCPMLFLSLFRALKVAAHSRINVTKTDQALPAWTLYLVSERLACPQTVAALRSGDAWQCMTKSRPAPS